VVPPSGAPFTRVQGLPICDATEQLAETAITATEAAAPTQSPSLIRVINAPRCTIRSQSISVGRCETNKQSRKIAAENFMCAKSKLKLLVTQTSG
jgi:hypothetical protein